MAQPATRTLSRLSEIAQVMVRHGFGYFFEAHRLTDLIPGRSSSAGMDTVGPSSARGQHLREVFEELGPTFVKFGQLLSTRPDLVPPDIIAELRALQDDVRPFPFEQAERVIEEELGNSIDRLFLDFEPIPVAAASIGQVHRATLPNGHAVAVKVQRPGAARQIEADLALLYQAARLLKERVHAFDFVDARSLVDEFARQIRQELDYRLEGRNAQAFHRNFAGDLHVHVPKVYWTYSRARVLTLEWLEGTQLADVDSLDLTLPERRDLAYLVAETWMTMIFRHGFFHGDPHPANVLVLREAGTIGLVDFGAAGTLSDDDMTKLTRLFIDAASENVDMLPRRLADLGVRYPKEREQEFLAELREMYYRYYGASLAEIDPIQVIREAFQLIYTMNLRLPTRYLLLDRAIATLGSVGICPRAISCSTARSRRSGRSASSSTRTSTSSRSRGRMRVRSCSSGSRRNASRSGRSGTRSDTRRSSARRRTSSTTSWSRCATARSRSASCTRASTTSSSRYSASSTGSSSRSSSPAASSARASSASSRRRGRSCSGSTPSRSSASRSRRCSAPGCSGASSVPGRL